MSKHSPAPWVIVEEADPKIISSWSIQIGDQSISFFPYVYQYGDEERTCGGYVSSPERHANARLIAAAPELLEALVAAEAALNNIRVCCHHTAWDATGPAVIAARAAIAKARGES